jgi:threonine/homoserine/homoserine lactone efflux protein
MSYPPDNVRAMSWHHILVFLPAAVLVALTPGANNLLALSNGMRSGARAAVSGLVGRLGAFAVLLTLAVAGLGALLTASQTAFEVVRWLGVGYLVYLGVRMIVRPGDYAPDPERARQPWTGLARREFLVFATNPKAMLLFTAFLPAFVDTTRPVWPQLVLLGALYVVVELLAATAYAVVGSRLSALKLSARGHRRMQRGSGGLMLGAAGLLATAKAPS